MIIQMIRAIARRLGFTPDTVIFESPIEKMLYAALTKAKVSDVRLQHKIGPYRADFALLRPKIAIECDGHDYHSSKEQREHDARRDRYFVEKGWRVLRFTGREIYRDAAGCAKQVARVVNENRPYKHSKKF